ncbi:hypothetical protein CPB84DRAFT_1769163 [Gymnopilus junonius]|uniref:Uncharacterized protein n=1 Tax=Gymnopilus junonius TaxID=109634 RepID=A0A9P5NSD8_GYMJU|nr:hypothetical protein CPB84DRAFT_1769163 [Gymnopilus junonius]
MAKPQFPWELLKAECLRLVCSQLVQASEEGGSYQGAFRKDDMIEFLHDVEGRGLETAVKNMEQTQTPRKTATSQAQTSPKRKSSRLEEENEGEENEGPNYNTRFKGSKRVKLTQEDREPASTSKPTTPRKSGRPKKSAQVASEGEPLSARTRARPRKSTEKSTTSSTAKRGRGRPTKSSEDVESSTPAKRGKGRPKKSAETVGGDKDAAEDEEKEDQKDGQQENFKRGRGRPKKSAEDVPTSKPPASRGRQVLVGVVLESRKDLLLQANNISLADNADGDAGPSGAAPEGSEGADGEEEIAVAAAVDLNGFVGGEAASATDSSIKENDPNDMIFISVNETEIHVDVDADAEGDDDVAL